MRGTHQRTQCSVRLLTRPLTAQPKPRAGIHASPACLRLVDSPTNQPKSEPITPCHSRQLRSPPPPYLRLRPTCDLQHPPALPCLSYPLQRQGSSSLSFVPPRFTCPLLVHLLALTLPRRHHHPPIPSHLVLVRTASLYIGRRCSLSAVLPVPLCSSLHSDLYRTHSVYRCVPAYLSHHPGWSCPPPRWRLPTSRYLHFHALLCSVPSCLTVPRSLSRSLSSSALFPLIIPSALESWTGRRACPLSLTDVWRADSWRRLLRAWLRRLGAPPSLSPRPSSTTSAFPRQPTCLSPTSQPTYRDLSSDLSRSI